MSSLKVFRRMPTLHAETGRSDSSDANSVRVIRDVWISNAGVTASTTVDGISEYSRRLRKGESEAWFLGMRRRPLSEDMPAPP
jgi:hypothetical protein